MGKLSYGEASATEELTKKIKEDEEESKPDKGKGYSKPKRSSKGMVADKGKVCI